MPNLADWLAIFALAVAIVALVKPEIVRDLWRRVCCRDGSRCEQLLWKHVPEGRLHRCQPMCPHPPAHVPSERCWEGTIGSLFNQAWVAALRRGTVPKPEGLDLGKQFLLTDVDTILAFVLCSVGTTSSFRWRQDEGGMYCDNTTVNIKSSNGVVTAHVRGPIRQESPSLTKKEISMMLKGYPPFYREQVSVFGGAVIPSPIQTDADVQRGGWVIILGLSSVRPLSLFMMPGEEEATYSPTSYRNGRQFRTAIRRVHDILNNHFLRQFPNHHRYIQNVVDSIQELLQTGTASALIALPSLDIYAFNGEQCHTIVTVFNAYRPLTTNELAVLTPIITSVLSAALLGAVRITEYLKDRGKKIILPRVLMENRWSEIYLRDCILKNDK
jgi:hypothetical protein